MADVKKVIQMEDGTLTNLVDSVSKQSVNYKKVTTWYDGTPMTNSKCDGNLYRRKGSEYFRKVIDKDGELFLEKDTVVELRGLSSFEVLLLKAGVFRGVKLNGYYQKGDTPSPIEYYLSNTTEDDDGGSVFEVVGVKLEHDFKGDIDVRYYGAKCDGVSVDTDSWQRCINSRYSSINKSLVFSGTSIIDRTLYFNYSGLRICGDNVLSSRIIKKGNETTDIDSTDGFDYKNVDAVIMSVDYVGDFTFKRFRIVSSDKSEYGLFTNRTFRFLLEDMYVESCVTNIMCHQTWNCNITKVRSRFSDYAFVFEGGSESNPLQHTSISFDNTYAEYAKFGYKLVNVTYFSGNSISSDNITECAYWFIFSTGGINGMGNEKSSGQLLRSWASNITINGHSVLEPKNRFGTPLFAKSKAKFEISSHGRSSSGVNINNSEIRGYLADNREGEADYVYIDNGAYFNIHGFRHYEFTVYNINVFSITGTGVFVRNNNDGYKVTQESDSPFSVNGVNLSPYKYGYNQNKIINRLDDVVIINTSSGNSAMKTISVKLSDIIKTFPDFGNTSDPYTRDFYDIKVKTNVFVSNSVVSANYTYKELCTKNNANAPVVDSVSIDAANDLVTVTLDRNANRPILTLSRQRGSIFRDAGIIANSEASTLEGLVIDFNNLLEKLRSSGVIRIS